MNGYFKLKMNQGSTSVILYPPTDGGAPINPGELLQYLTIKQITYDAGALNTALKTLTEPTEVCINLDTRYPEPEVFFVRISPDKMQAVARFYPPSDGGNALNLSTIVRDLNYQKITFGIQEGSIRNFCSKREYCKDIIVALGQEPVQGHDASIEYYFNTDLRIKPTLLEDGSVDFFHLNTLNSCHQGDILARLFQAEAGTPGRTIYGDIVKPRDVKRLNLKYGKNISIDESKTVLSSQVDGHVMLVDHSVFVSNVYEVENVDNSTGNIEYDGSVKINGNVKMNFIVKAKGNVEITGVVEGARIEAGGDIIIARGMNGMNRGVLSAGGNIISKFLENTSVEAGGYVETESILHCKVSAKTEILLNGKKAFITGGHVCATNKVSLKTIGSPLGADTTVEVGIDPSVKTEYQKLQKDVVEMNNNLKQIKPVILGLSQKLQSGVKLNAEQIKYLQTLAMTNKQLEEKVSENLERMEDLAKIMEESTNASIVVTGEVYPGTKIIIMDSSITVKDTIQHCRFIRSQGEVVMASI